MEKNQDKQQIRRYLNGAYNSHEAKEMAESLLRADKEAFWTTWQMKFGRKPYHCPNLQTKSKSSIRKKLSTCLRVCSLKNAHSPSGYSIWLRVSLHLFL